MQSPSEVRKVEHVMGTAVSVHVVDQQTERILHTAAATVFSWLHEVDQRFSTYRSGSEISRLGRGEVDLADCSPDVRTVLDQCADLTVLTDGWFDLYATGRLDPSGYVKGWAVQVASDRLLTAGFDNHCINAGGDVRVRGHRRRGQGWRIGIRHPWQPRHTSWVLAGSDLAVATSGTYERGCHVIDARHSVPAGWLRSVTVVGTDLGLADAYATAAVAMGQRGLHWLAQLPAHEVAVITEDGHCFRSDGLPTVSALADEAVTLS